MENTYAYEQQTLINQNQIIPARRDCGCGGSRMLMPSPLPDGPGPGGQSGFGPGGPGGFEPGGPGGFGPGGPGGFGPGGPGGFGPGGQDGFGPGGPGFFPPPHPPFPPFPFPFPIPFPIPFPPGPGPLASVLVFINGGYAFPTITQGYRVPFRPGLTIYQALAETGVIRFNAFNQIIAVSGIPIGRNINYQLLLNGRLIPQTLLNFPLQRNDFVSVQLIFTP